MEWNTYNEKMEHTYFRTYQSLINLEKYSKGFSVLSNRLVDAAFLIFPFGAESENQLIELMITVAASLSAKFNTLMSSPIHENRMIYTEIYMCLNFVVRYSVGERRVKQSEKKRGAAFYVRYNKILLKAHK